MRTMFAVGHQNRTHTMIVIKGRLLKDRRTDAANAGPLLRELEEQVSAQAAGRSGFPARRVRDPAGG